MRTSTDRGTGTPPRGTVIVTETGEGKFHQWVRAGRHTLSADEPIEFGGQDGGPSPYDYLLASLGACTSMTVRMYADRKGFSLQRVGVRLTHSRIHAKDCAACETKEGKVDHIERVLELEGDLSEEQREKLLEIANKCPVHRTLTSEIRIETRLVKGEEEGSTIEE